MDDWLGGLAHDSDEVDETEDNNGNGNGHGRRKKAVPRNRSNVITAALSNMLSFSVRASTFDAMNRKRLLRAPRWLDAGQKARKRANAVSALFGNDDALATPRIIEFDPSQHLAAGRVVVIRAPAEGREYGLFLSYVLRRINLMLSLRRINFPVCCFIDEAHEVFSGEKAVAEAATTSVQRAVVKGRSLGNGFVFSTQNPSQLPETILNNLNSRVIHRQNSRDELKLGIPSAPEELLNTAMTLGPGQAIVSIQGSRAPVTAEMAPSPFKLTKLTGQGARRFLSEQFEEEPAVT
jgi:hypothetical protein